MIASILVDEAFVGTVNIASEVSSKRTRHGTGMSRNLGVSKGSKHARVSVTFCGLDYRSASVNVVVRSLE
jgi:hypothetical protein